MRALATEATNNEKNTQIAYDRGRFELLSLVTFFAAAKKVTV
jgi:hypothetical protein